MKTRLLITILFIIQWMLLGEGNILLAQTLRMSTEPSSLSDNPRYTALLKPSQYLALDVISPFRFRRYRFFEGDEIRFKARGETYQDQLYAVTDTSFSILAENEVMARFEPVSFRFDEVKWVRISRRIPFVSAGAVALPIAGTLFAVADFVNAKGADGKSGRFRLDPSSLVPAGALIAAGAVCYKLSHARYRINKNHRLKMLGH